MPAAIMSLVIVFLVVLALWLRGAALTENSLSDYSAAAISATVALAAFLLLIGLATTNLGVLPYKMLSQVETWPDTKVIYSTQGPLGRIDVVTGPSIHYARAWACLNCL